MRVYINNPGSLLISECEDRAVTQKSVALTYCFAMRAERELGEKQDWPAMNAAIRARWPRGLERVKRMAWVYFNHNKTAKR